MSRAPSPPLMPHLCQTALTFETTNPEREAICRGLNARNMIARGEAPGNMSPLFSAVLSGSSPPEPGAVHNSSDPYEFKGFEVFHLLNPFALTVFLCQAIVVQIHWRKRS
jgi:hypothetical protein